MSIPANLTQVTLTATYLGPSGTPAAGTVEFALSSAAADPGAPAIVPPSSVVLTLDGAGHLSVALPATDDPHWAATGLLYRVTEKITGAPWRTFYVALPRSAAPTVDLATLAPAAPLPAFTSYVLASVVGVAGGVAPLDGSALLPVANLPSVPANLLPPTDLDVNVAPAGCWYATPNQGSIGVTGALAAGTAYLTALRLSRAATLSGVAIEVTTTDTGVARFGVASEVNGQPGVWLADLGTVVVTGAGLVQLAPLAQALAASPAGDVWLAVIPQGGTGTLALRARTGSDPSIPLTVASNANCGPLNSARTCYSSTAAFAGALTIGGPIALAAVTLGPCVGVRLS